MRLRNTGRDRAHSHFGYQLDTGGDPNRKVYAIGTVLNLYF